MINLLVTLDSGYVFPLCTMLSSLVENNRGEIINLYVAHSSLTSEDFKKIKNALGNSDAEIYPIKLDDGLFKNAPTKKQDYQGDVLPHFCSSVFAEVGGQNSLH